MILVCLGLMFGFIWHSNPKFDPRPVFEAIQEHFIPLRLSGTEWGEHITRDPP